MPRSRALRGQTDKRGEPRSEQVGSPLAAARSACGPVVRVGADRSKRAAFYYGHHDGALPGQVQDAIRGTLQQFHRRRRAPRELLDAQADSER